MASHPIIAKLSKHLRGLYAGCVPAYEWGTVCERDII